MSWIYMKPTGEYEAETSGPMRYSDWEKHCMMALLYQRRRGGGTCVVFHVR